MVLRALLLLAFAAIGVASPASAQSLLECKLCTTARSGDIDSSVPLRVEITTDLSFSRLALTSRSGGAAAIDPQSGAKRAETGMIDLGGMALTGRGRVTGEPHRTVRIQLPTTIEMSSAGGESARLGDLVTDLPMSPMLDANGVLEFSFGGRITVQGNRGGKLRGRIPITVEYD